MDNEIEEIEKQDGKNISGKRPARPALIGDPVMGRIGDQQRFERQRATIARSRFLAKKKNERKLLPYRSNANYRNNTIEEYQRKETDYLNEDTERDISPTHTRQKDIEENNIREANSSYNYNDDNVDSGKNYSQNIQKRSEAPKQKDKLDFSSVFILIGTALLFDTIQLLASFIIIDFGLISLMVSFFAFMTIWFMFWIKSIKFNTKVRSLSFGGASIMELVPLLNALPSWTLATVVIIITTKGKGYTGLIPGGEKITKITQKTSRAA